MDFSIGEGKAFCMITDPVMSHGGSVHCVVCVNCGCLCTCVGVMFMNVM